MSSPNPEKAGNWIYFHLWSPVRGLLGKKSSRINKLDSSPCHMPHTQSPAPSGLQKGAIPTRTAISKHIRRPSFQLTSKTGQHLQWIIILHEHNFAICFLRQHIRLSQSQNQSAESITLLCLTKTYFIFSPPRGESSESVICGSGQCAELPFPGIAVVQEVKVSTADKEEFAHQTACISDLSLGYLLSRDQQDALEQPTCWKKVEFNEIKCVQS